MNMMIKANIGLACLRKGQIIILEATLCYMEKQGGDVGPRTKSVDQGLFVVSKEFLELLVIMRKRRELLHGWKRPNHGWEKGCRSFGRMRMERFSVVSYVMVPWPKKKRWSTSSRRL